MQLRRVYNVAIVNTEEVDMRSFALVAALAFLCGCSSIMKVYKPGEPIFVAVAGKITYDACFSADIPREYVPQVLATLAHMSALGPKMMQSDIAKQFVGNQALDFVWYGYSVACSMLDEKIPDNEVTETMARVLQSAIGGCVNGLKEKLSAS